MSAVVARARVQSTPPQTTPTQPRPEIARLAAETAKKVAKLKARSVLTTPLADCFGERELCDELDAALHAELSAAIPRVHFVPREEAVKHLDSHGFLEIDAYLGALDDVAGEAGADAVISESVAVKSGRCEVQTIVADAKRRASQTAFREPIDCPATSDTNFTLMTDAASGAAIPVPKAQGRRTARAGEAPQCTSCPPPRYTVDLQKIHAERSVRLLVTVTRVGTLANPAVLGMPANAIVQAALQAMRQWRLIPASDKNGKTYARRMLFEVQFGPG